MSGTECRKVTIMVIFNILVSLHKVPELVLALLGKKLAGDN